MKFTGEDYTKALKEWVSADLKESPRQHYDLGKFFFTVSIGTLGALVAMKKGSGSLAISLSLGLSLIFLVISLFASLLMAIPREKPMSAQTDLQEAHTARIRLTTEQSGAWFGLWLLGVILGGVSLLE